MFGRKKQTNIVNGEDSQTEVYIVSELRKLRYEIEHKAIRDAFFNETKNFILSIAQDGAYGLYRRLFELVNMDFPYKVSDFKIESMEIDEGTFPFFLELPKPEYVPLCYRMYSIINDDFTAHAFYTIESGLTGGFLCGWNQKGDHINYNELASPEWKEHIGFLRAVEANIIIDLYKKQAAAEAEQ